MKEKNLSPYIHTKEYTKDKGCMFDAREIEAVMVYDTDHEYALAYELLLKSGHTLVVYNRILMKGFEDMDLWTYIDRLLGCEIPDWIEEE